MEVSLENVVGAVIGLAGGTLTLVIGLVKFVVPRIEKGYDKAFSTQAEQNHQLLKQLSAQNESIHQLNISHSVSMHSIDETAIAIKEQSQSIRDYAKALSELAMGINRHQEKVNGAHDASDSKHVDILREIRK